MRNIIRDEWTALLNSFNDQFQGRAARLEVVGAGGAQHVLAERLPFAGLTADLKDGEHAAAIMLATPDGATATHTVGAMTGMRVDELNGRVARVEIDGGDGTTTVLTLH
jgi:hypothetical protein